MLAHRHSSLKRISWNLSFLYILVWIVCPSIPPPLSVSLRKRSHIFIRLSCLSMLVLMASCGDWALTKEAQRNLMELWHGPIFVMWLVGPATFVLLHPSICVGWTDPSQESPNCLLALSIYLLHPSCHPSLSLANLLILLYLVNLFNLFFYFYCV